ncbi:MAPEG family protein [Pseudoalteromonas sp. JBTF-M23]|uniref:MAPEG family protein n=1 Tax=Pseudoalteromonas caenipelagi TaxID=2726988 RepID=A0A849VGX3_9GAMM|nr:MULTISPECIES: MAPEG family protein [Pseudoalteromonas]MBD1582706.1 MAPEG family protein [Pseudoalteromonas sp. S16_S37]NOU52999.1 MAPEG family protein [Pseudoalteromonas caenipelagi]
MTTILICALIAVILPYLAKAPVAIAMNRLGGYDNQHPRAQQAQLTGFGARALAAHQNCFESLTVFAVAVAVVLGTNTVGSTVQYLAIGHIVARILYCVFYYLNLHIFRSLIWAVGLGCAIAMIAVSL